MLTRSRILDILAGVPLSHLRLFLGITFVGYSGQGRANHRDCNPGAMMRS